MSGHPSQRRPANVSSIQLTPQENECLFNHLGRKCIVSCLFFLPPIKLFYDSWLRNNANPSFSGVSCLHTRDADRFEGVQRCVLWPLVWRSVSLSQVACVLLPMEPLETSHWRGWFVLTLWATVFNVPVFWGVRGDCDIWANCKFVLLPRASSADASLTYSLTHLKSPRKSPPPRCQLAWQHCA